MLENVLEKNQNVLEKNQNLLYNFKIVLEKSHEGDFVNGNYNKNRERNKVFM